MKKRKNLMISVVVIAVVFTILFVVWSNYKPTKMVYFEGCIETTIDLNNLEDVIGEADYVFVGYVEETYDYNHDRFFHDFPKVIDYYGGPYTECVVTVTECIKGNIPQGEKLSYFWVGGVTNNRMYIYSSAQEGQTDYYPQVGNYYVFKGMAHPDGTITGGGSFGTDLLEQGIDKTNYKQSTVYKKWIDAYQNSDKTIDRFPYVCKADINYDDGNYNAEIYERYLEWKKEIDSPVDEKYYEAIKDGNPKIK